MEVLEELKLATKYHNAIMKIPFHYLFKYDRPFVSGLAFAGNFDIRPRLKLCSWSCLPTLMHC